MSKKIFNCIILGDKQKKIFKNFDHYVSEKFPKDLPRIPKFQIVKNIEEFEKEYDGTDINAVGFVLQRKEQVDLMKKIYDEQKKNLEIIHSFTVGVDKFLPKIKHFDLSNIIITNAKGSFSGILAEYVLYAILYFAKNTPYFKHVQKEKKWVEHNIHPIKDATVSIIGLGDVGTQVAKQCKLNGMKVIAVKRDPLQVTQEQKELCDGNIYGNYQLDEVLEQSDYVVSVLPAVQETNDIFNLQKFKKMKKKTVFINIGRGNCVVEEDLEIALKEHIIRGACLDVFKKEPLPKESGLWDLENILLTSHSGNRTPDLFMQSQDAFMENLKLHLQGKQMKNIVHLDRGY